MKKQTQETYATKTIESYMMKGQDHIQNYSEECMLFLDEFSLFTYRLY